MNRLAPFVLTMGFAFAVTGPSWAQEGKPKADPAAKAPPQMDGGSGDSAAGVTVALQRKARRRGPG